MNNITQEYYSMLVSVNHDLKIITNELKKDTELVTILKKVLNDPKVLPTLFLHDIFQSVKIIHNGKWCDDYRELLSCLTFFYTILENREMYSFEKLLNLNKLSEFNFFTNSIKNIAMNKLDIDLSNDEERITGKNNLALLPILKALESESFDSVLKVIYHCANVITKADGIVTKEESENLKSLYEVLQDPVNIETKAIFKQNTKTIEIVKNVSIEEILDELNSLVGLTEIKNEVTTLINLIKVQQQRKNVGLKNSSFSYHMVFTGNPGTGKTTVARIIAKIYKSLGVLEEGQLVETDRSGLIGKYVGHTAIKTNELVDSCLNGILFIDEAYSLTQGGENDYGQEAIATLVKRMEDDRDKLIVICAGYTADMERFINMNSGLKSRFNKYLEFPDYTPDELVGIYLKRSSNLDYKLTEDANTKLYNVMEKAYTNRDNTFGNARYARNLFEKTLEKQANRIASIGHLTHDILCTIEVLDIPDYTF